ncbi:putative proteinase inhibitor I3, Kunitz legume [Medicago truncatula]|uniref:Kunitz type trypsin inhibitor / Alpha-fucosidase n=1 Tax=Medicago truncatula TaxID=3880 RepID=I3SQY8_MEDTR|nr:kunitz-type trypsin inhibitor-like 1 protein [Medicago truncatula]AFK42680.1 unknown [Medicago truncatula]KEH26656.1 Kunitz type trypsin inhibitor / Alpha-fucosidase [Medicago truncatula]RHN52189.1 putative proteinase inhibitor I3, Kunitz legume [Medicago truncatula]
MKPVLSLTLSFFLFSFITNISPNNAIEQVLDINGTPLTPGGQYYILPESDNPSIGGLILNKIDDLECPVTVVQDITVIGLPVKFSMLENSTSNILPGTDLEIEFTTKPDCAKSSKWSMFVDHDTQLSFVGIGGSANNPGVETTSGKFLVVKHQHGSGHAYRIGFCLDTTGDCGFIALEFFNSEDGGPRLIFTVNDAYSVVFVDAASIKSASHALPI